MEINTKKKDNELFKNWDKMSLDKKIDNYIKKTFKSIHSKGISVALISPSKVLMNKQYGNVKNGDQQFVLGSLSKSFTALAIMKLVKEGKIDLDSPISKYLIISPAPPT